MIYYTFFHFFFEKFFIFFLIVLERDFTLAELGEPISVEQAKLLKAFGEKLGKRTLSVKAWINKDGKFDRVA